MNLILLWRDDTAARTFNIPAPAVAIGILLLICLIIGAGIGYVLAPSADGILAHAQIEALKRQLVAQQEVVRRTSVEAREEIDALAVRMGELNANVIRLNALGRRLTGMANLDDGEFNFDSRPAVGGGPEDPVTGPETHQSAASLGSGIDSLDRLLYEQEQQLTVLEDLMLNRKLQDRVRPKGRPIAKGWISSYFGKRTDPFTGKVANHRGVDFAGRAGTEVVAVAAGVVSWSGDRFGYGQMVEINHGNGYVTRYAHNSQNLVAVGDNVRKGQVIALMGSTGRATGPNLHFEVWHRGHPVNPLKYIQQTT